MAPSSLALARRIAEAAKIHESKRVLELGPGTGALTEAVAEALPKGSEYLGLELNEIFVKQLGQRFPNLRFEAVPAQEFDFNQWPGEGETFDAVVSGLPWTAFPESLQKAILDHVLPRLRPGGIFVTFAYTGFHLLPKGRCFRDLLASRCYKLTTTTTVWGNLPPAFVYVATAGEAVAPANSNSGR
ncbi:class I SAM-dependent methyltransferase [Roseimicrobium gellanilyticum]|uniref:class I SAM-dependent methyltransferase n=1 Tax=Roseimicrobium gellanilyticum TaxID=748857 RepID=UPI001472A16A|nr:methyltransferase domain-containing protein [Roseimicrobium gellanilyticum]